MKYYFRLLSISVRRTLKEGGLPLLLAVFLFLIVMVLLSGFAHQYPKFAPYYFGYIAFAALQRTASAVRVEFLEMQFGRKMSCQIRVIENLLLTLPWFYLAVFMRNGYLLATLLICAVGMAFIRRLSASRSLQTPFPRRLFEVVIFFRRYLWYILVITMALTGIACYVDNFNLGLVCLATVLLIACSAQDYREPEFFIWSYTLHPVGFIKMKILRSTSQVGILVSPIVVMLITFFPAQFVLVLLCLMAGLAINAVYILMKYAIYPRVFAMPDLIVILVGIAFPLILPFIVYRYYQKAQKNLSAWL